MCCSVTPKLPQQQTSKKKQKNIFKTEDGSNTGGINIGLKTFEKELNKENTQFRFKGF